MELNVSFIIHFIYSLIRMLQNCHCEPRSILKVYDQTYTNDVFIYADNLPELKSFTVCTWLNIHSLMGNHNYLLSLSNNFTENELRLKIDSANSWLVFILNGVDGWYKIEFENTVGFERLFSGWQRHCWSWESGQSLKWFASASDTNVLDLIASVDTDNHMIRAGGALTILHEQDSILGGFALNQITLGKLSGFNMWSQAHNYSQLQEQTCESEGDVVKPDSLVISGGSYIQEHILCMNCTERQAPETLGTPALVGASVTMRSKWLHPPFLTYPARTEIRCVAICFKVPQCNSVNYNKETGDCELIALSDTDNQWLLVPTDNVEDESVTFMEC